MDTNRIRYFLSLARTGSITKAAELHHISPPAFSKAIKVFEDEVGQALTIPHGRGLILTDVAKSLVPSLEEIIQKIEAVKEGTFLGAQSSQHHLRIATFEVFSTHFMAKALTQFKDYKCSVLEMIPGHMEEAVATHKADLALTYIPIPHPELDFLRVQEIEMGLFGHNSLNENFDYNEVKFAAPIAPITGSPTKVRGLDGWPDEAYPRNIYYRVQMLETALGICRQGLGVAYIPKFVAQLHNEIVRSEFQIKEFSLPSKFPKRKDYVYLIKRKSDIESLDVKKIAAIVRKICK